MNIQCENCSRKFVVKDSDIPKNGRTVQCGYCSVTWHQMPVAMLTEKAVQTKKKLPTSTDDESPSVDKIKASDGKNYRFLGSQWAELLPSGKTGLFARKKISNELDEITGRKEKKIKKKRSKKIEEVNPSSDSLDNEKNIPNNELSKEGLGFLGYIFLIIIIAFSLVGILKTFERDLLNHLPEMEYIFALLNEQLEYLSESVKNFIVIINDLINFY
jgi:predicted Zn finger-like uncharacterized protein